MSFAAKIDRLLELSSNDDGTTNELEPHLFAANANPNILSHSEAKRADDYDKFQEAMQDEFKQMIESKNSKKSQGQQYLWDNTYYTQYGVINRRPLWQELSINMDLVSVQMAVTNNMV